MVSHEEVYDEASRNAIGMSSREGTLNDVTVSHSADCPLSCSSSAHAAAIFRFRRFFAA
jgi:hypothetical protein